MGIRVGINGFGRIGRSVLRLAFEKFDDIEIVAVNDLVPAPNLAYLVKYDSVHGRFSLPIQSNDEAFIIDDKHTVHVLAEKDPTKLPWKELSVDYVIESTGLFTERDNAEKHIEAGAKRVIISAPAKGAVPTYVMGVNHEKYNPEIDTVVSNASCTTNCLAPITKVLLDHFGIEEGLMTTVHALTPTQPVHDGPSKKDLRGGRSSPYNIIPASTGAAKAVSLCLPEVQGKLTGMAFRVPVADVSVVDLTVKLTKSTDYATLCAKMKSEANSNLKGILGFTDEEVVSSDFIGDTHSSIFDAHAGIALNDNFFKLISWYDNEIGYSCRLLDLIRYIATKET
ncbi:MAG: type I glyceraldehyde-3-phosphate dehydrogenase [Chlamydiales bacterium]|nr:type I glyceraldehyde-3-phosphate dehydrogenase [Chlamydiia bacterium]MCP5503803.1 type I glyceraldehyde-3-phosphate dehydrogenase [Chlamydiales bacterium]